MMHRRARAQVSRQRWPVWLLVIGLGLGLALAGCGGDDDDDTGGDDPPVDTTAPDAPDADATEEVGGDGFEFLPAEPGLNVQNGLTLVRHNEGQRDDRAYFFAEIRNDTGETVRAVEVTIYPLDAQDFQLDYVDGSTLLEDIPPDTVIYAGTSFLVGEAFADTQVWVRYAPGTPRREGYFDLPATVEYHGPDEQLAYAVRGTAQNDTGQPLIFPIITVALIGPDEDLVGVTRAVVRTTTPDGSWPPGEAVEFEALFPFIALDDPTLVSEALVSAVGYAPRSSEDE